VHVWRVWLGPEGDRFAHVLSDAERAAAGRLRSTAHALISGRAHSALRLILARYAEIHPAAVRLAQQPGRRPRATDPDLEFSLAHSGELALVGVAPCREPVGVDVERLEPLPDLDRVARAALTDHERSHVGPDDHAAMLRIWCRKEAYLKAIGTGLARSPATVETLADGSLPGYRLIDLDPGSGYLAAACVRDQAAEVLTLSWTWPAA
jgi:4'-phosphopantetheinyl transferase